VTRGNRRDEDGLVTTTALCVAPPPQCARAPTPFLRAASRGSEGERWPHRPPGARPERSAGETCRLRQVVSAPFAALRSIAVHAARSGQLITCGNSGAARDDYTTAVTATPVPPALHPHRTTDRSEDDSAHTAMPVGGPSHDRHDTMTIRASSRPAHSRRTKPPLSPPSFDLVASQCRSRSWPTLRAPVIGRQVHFWVLRPEMRETRRTIFGCNWPASGGGG
jgi:hypothetical protein